MIRQTYEIQIITPCFCGGAIPEQQAEIRAPSIRGQLRWWFRVLGGFRSEPLAAMPVREQENLIFGSTAGETGTAGKLQVRIHAEGGKSLFSSAEFPVPGMQSPEGYLVFPLRNKPRRRSALTDFRLDLTWRGTEALAADLAALASVLGNLGALGFRSRRAMGALACAPGSLPLRAALERFASSTTAINVRRLNLRLNSSEQAISALAQWLRGWRQHGRSQDLRPGNQDGKPPENPGFWAAKRDHDIGYSVPAVAGQPAFRPALGLPIVQRISGSTNNWEWERNPKGRFASPVLLRPHKDAEGNWHALVIFVDAHRWPAGKKVYLNGTACDVSTDLYEAMKADSQLKSFP